MTATEKSKNRKYELVAPDGGWGYVVAIGFIINSITLTAFLNCFGMIYKDMFIKLNMDSTCISLLNGLAAFCTSFNVIITSPLLNYLSIRQLGVIAAIVYNLGGIGMVFVNSKLTFFICFGILQVVVTVPLTTESLFQSLGTAVLMNLSFTVVNDYFVKKRLLAVSFTQTIIAISALITPQFLNWSLNSYGLRGTLLLISGITMHNILGIILMQPVEWHKKKVEVPENKENESVLPEMKSLLAEESKLPKIENPSQKIQIVDTAIITEKHNPEDGTTNCSSPTKRQLSDLVDFKMYRSLLLSNASIGMAICVFSELMFTIMLPQALYSMGWNEGMVAWAFSLNAMGDLTTRFLFIFLSNWLLNFGSHEIYVSGLVIAFIARLGMLASENVISMMTFITIMGVSRSTIMVLIPLVVADSVKPKQFTGAMGLQIALVGLFNLTVGPLIGAVRDLTDSYATAFYILASCFGIVIIFWSIELLYKKNKHKRQWKENKA